MRNVCWEYVVKSFRSTFQVPRKRVVFSQWGDNEVFLIGGPPSVNISVYVPGTNQLPGTSFLIELYHFR